MLHVVLGRWAMRNPHRWNRMGLVVVVLLGVLAMHGLGPHGTATSGSGLAAAGHGIAMATSDLPAMPDETEAGANHGVQAGPPGDASSGHSLVELCLAVLLGLGIALLALAARGRRSRAWAAVPGLLGRRLAHFRSPDPPSLSQLSLLRC